MNSNKSLTWALYLLLGGLVSVFGYKACLLKKEQAEKLAVQNEMEQTLRDMGYQADTAATSGVAKPSDLTDTKMPVTTTSEPKTEAKDKATAAESAAKPVTSSTASTAKAEPVKPKYIDNNDELIGPPEAKSVKTGSKSGLKTVNSKGIVVPKTIAKAPAKPAYAVIAASFASKPSARKVMEALVKKGFTNAEISTKGKFFVVISERTANKDEAAKMAAKVAKEADCAKAYVYKRP
jgi:SPOR domain